MNSSGRKNGRRSFFWRVIYSRVEPSDEVPFLVKFMIKHNIARNEFQAFLLMAVLIVGFTSMSLFLLPINKNVGGFVGAGYYKRNSDMQSIPVGVISNLPATSVGELQASPRGIRR